MTRLMQPDRGAGRPQSEAYTTRKPRQAKLKFKPCDPSKFSSGKKTDKFILWKPCSEIEFNPAQAISTDSKSREHCTKKGSPNTIALQNPSSTCSSNEAITIHQTSTSSIVPFPVTPGTCVLSSVDYCRFYRYRILT